jgi:DNA ligase 1
MQAFTRLYQRLDETTGINEKVAALADYFRDASADDAAWAVALLVGRRPPRAVSTRQLGEWCAQVAQIPEWLFQECYESVGDLAETMALVLPPPSPSTASVSAARRASSNDVVTPSDDAVTTPPTVAEESLAACMAVVLSLKRLPLEQQAVVVQSAWSRLPAAERFIWNKLMTGGFRVGVSERLVTRGLSRTSGVPAETLVLRLRGDWTPTAEAYRALISLEDAAVPLHRPYPFCLAHALPGTADSELVAETENPWDAEREQQTGDIVEDRAAAADADVIVVASRNTSAVTSLGAWTEVRLNQELGPIEDWQLEWKWDGIRAQIIRRGGQQFVWSRGEELMESRFPELRSGIAALPDGVVLDGELVGFTRGRVLPFSELQRRIGRKTVSKKMQQDVPVRFLAFDLLEWEGVDMRARPLQERLARLQQLVPDTLLADSGLVQAPRVDVSSWSAAEQERQSSRQRGVEGLMLKRRDSPYLAGRATNLWWKWKVDPYTIDAVLLYAQKGHGRRANLFTDYTFAVWDEERLVPFAKAYSGLTDAEIREVDRFVRDHAREKFGPVTSVQPVLVFELAFEQIQRSTRHKSGIAVRFPRIVRWRRDKTIEQADSLATIHDWLARQANLSGAP